MGIEAHSREGGPAFLVSAALPAAASVEIPGLVPVAGACQLALEVEFMAPHAQITVEQYTKRIPYHAAVRANEGRPRPEWTMLRHLTRAATWLLVSRPDMRLPMDELLERMHAEERLRQAGFPHTHRQLKRRLGAWWHDEFTYDNVPIVATSAGRYATVGANPDFDITASWSVMKDGRLQRAPGC